MDQAIAQLLADRLGMNGDDYNALQAGDLSSLLSSQLAGQFSQNPLMAMLISSMLQQNAVASTREVSENEIDYERVLARARQIIQQLKEQLVRAQAMISYIAEVFGTCPACWGQSKICPQCRGKGKPGSNEPLEEELLAWVDPALKRLGMRVVRTE